MNYSNAEDFNLWLGTGTDGLYIDSTHAGTTEVFMGDGNATVNQRDDTVVIKSIGGTTTIHGQGGNDFFYVNVQTTAANDNDAGFFAQLSWPLPLRRTTTSSNRCSSARTRTGWAGSQPARRGRYRPIHRKPRRPGDALINVLDNGAPDDGVDTLIVNGADVVSGLANHPDDTFLLRRDLVALLNGFVRRIRLYARRACELR